MNGQDDLSRLLYIDSAVFLPDDLMIKNDTGVCMSELLNNSDYRKKVFKEMILKLHKGDDPDEVKKAQQVLAQKDRVLAQAQEEGNRSAGGVRPSPPGRLVVDSAPGFLADRCDSSHLDAQSKQITA